MEWLMLPPHRQVVVDDISRRAHKQDVMEMTVMAKSLQLLCCQTSQQREKLSQGFDVDDDSRFHSKAKK